MASALSRTAGTRGIHTWRESINTPEFPTASWILVRRAGNADITALKAAGVQPRYWKPTGVADGVREMTPAEKAAGPDLYVAQVGPYVESPDKSLWEVLVSNTGVVTTIKRV
jgi:hypothetical protein